MSEISIRKGQPEDLPNFKKGLIEMWVDHAKHEPGLLDEERMRQSNVDDYYKDAFNSDSTFVFVAEVDGNFAGVVRGDIQEIPNFFKDNKIIYLDDGFVLPEYRGRGIIGLLISEVEKAAKERGIKRLQSRVYTFNKPIQRALEKLGYHMPHSTWDKSI